MLIVSQNILLFTKSPVTDNFLLLPDLYSIKDWIESRIKFKNIESCDSHSLPKLFIKAFVDSLIPQRYVELSGSRGISSE
jgi:hypothetical protein